MSIEPKDVVEWARIAPDVAGSRVTCSPDLGGCNKKMTPRPDEVWAGFNATGGRLGWVCDACYATREPTLREYLDGQPTREAWLRDALAIHVAPYVVGRGYELPTVRASCGWTGSGMEGCTLGVCFDATASKDGTCEIFISPTIDDGERVMAILLHEVCHAIAGGKAGHDEATYGEVARSLGLTQGGEDGSGPWPTQAYPNEATRAWITSLRLPAYPHGAVTPPPPAAPTVVQAPAGKPQKCRLHKATCERCGYTVRVTMKWASRAMPICGACNVVFTLSSNAD